MKNRVGARGERWAFADGLGLEALQLTAGIRIYLGTPPAATAIAEGRLAADDDLLQPRF